MKKRTVTMQEAVTELRKFAEIYPEVADRVMRKDIRPWFSHQVNKRLRNVTPPRPKRPIEWTPSRRSEDAKKKPNTRWGYYSRQKAAFYATRGFGRGIPTQRTGAYNKGWQTRGQYRENIGVVTIENVAERISPLSQGEYRYAPYVAGAWQQEFHAITGWPNYERVVNDIMQEGYIRMLQAIDSVSGQMLNKTL